MFISLVYVVVSLEARNYSISNDDICLYFYFSKFTPAEKEGKNCDSTLASAESAHSSILKLLIAYR